MGELVRKLRGLTGMGVTWGVSWGLIGAGIGLVIELVSPEGSRWLDPVLAWGLGMGAYGFVSGVGFGKLLWFLEGRRTLHDLPLGRIATWGVLGGVIVPVLFGMAGLFDPATTLRDVVQAMAVTATLGGVFATGTVALARRGEEAGSGALAAGWAAGDERLLDAEPLADPLHAETGAREREKARR